MGNKRLRTIKKTVEDCGAEIVEIQQCGSSHIKALLRAPGREPRFFIMASTPSEKRGEKNNIADIKCWVRTGLNRRSGKPL
jgi:hypothetical protein